MLDTEEEYNFLKEAQKGFSNNMSYRIMGETTIKIGQFFEYANYTPGYVDKYYWYDTSCTGKSLSGTWKMKLLVVCSSLFHFHIYIVLCQKYERGTHLPHISCTTYY